MKAVIATKEGRNFVRTCAVAKAVFNAILIQCRKELLKRFDRANDEGRAGRNLRKSYWQFAIIGKEVRDAK